jgi:hypothetical protein
LLLILICLEFVPQPHRVAHALNLLQFEQGGWALGVVNAVKHCNHPFASVNAGTNHQAHFVDETCGKKGTVDMAAANEGYALNAKLC